MTWRKTISGKLTSIYALMFVIVLLLLNTAVYLGLNYFVRNNARQNLDRIMNFLSSRLLQYNYYNIDLMEELSRSEGNIYFRILSTNRNIRFQSNLLEDVDMPVVPGYQELKIGERTFIYTTRFILDQGDLYRLYPAGQGDNFRIPFSPFPFFDHVDYQFPGNHCCHPYRAYYYQENVTAYYIHYGYS